LDILNDYKKKNSISTKIFGTKYRRYWDKQDELFSTSSVRELMLGVLEKYQITMTPQQIKSINEVFNIISRVRIRTCNSGYALSKTDKMQHPTAKGSGIFADSSETMSRHNELDLARKEFVVKAMQEEVNNGSASFVTIALAGLRASIAFTLNEFTAPITAEDVHPFAIKGKKLTRSEKDSQLMECEMAKHIFIQLGGKQDIGKVDRGRNWGTLRKGKKLRTVSPPRLPRIPR
jgi:hypothetical protein